MNFKRLHITAAAATLALLGWTGQVAPAQEPQDIDDGGRVKVEVGTDPSNSLKLVPFPEDLDEPVEQAERSVEPGEQPKPLQTVQRASAPAAVPPSNFKPRFRTPAVHQAQHLEPSQELKTEARPNSKPTARFKAQGGTRASDPTKIVPKSLPADPAGDAAAPAAQPTAADDAVAEEAKPLIQQAFAKSKVAASDPEYTDIIDLCRRASEEGLSQEKEAYAKRLMSWSYNRRGEARATQRRDKEALADFEAACELNSQSWRAIHNRGVSYAAAGRVTEALDDFNRALQLNAKYPTAYFNRGELMYSQGHFQEAIRDYTAAIQLGPADVAMFNGRGHAYYRLQDLDMALRDYGEALKIDPKSAAVLVNRGDVYSELGRYADAAADYRSAVRADAKFPRAYQAAAWLMATCPDERYRNPKLAVNAARKAIALAGEDFRNLETLAAAEANSDQFREAKATQEKAIAKASGHELVAAEKRMAFYQRELAYREPSREDLAAADSEQRDGLEPRKYPVERASAEEAAGGQDVTYPEVQRLPGPQASQPPRQMRSRSAWGFLPQRGAPQQRPQGRPRMLPKTPTHPIGRN